MRPARPCLLRRFAANFARAERGAAALEFSLVALPLMLMIFATLELGLVLLASTTVETATETTGRLIRTGQFQQGSATSKADFKTSVCQNMTWLAGDCVNDLWVDVRTFPDFKTLATGAKTPPLPPPPTPSNPNPIPNTCFVVGGPGSIVLVRVYLRWKLFTPMMDGGMENMGPGTGLRLLSSTTAFRNEPYDASTPTPAPNQC